MPKHLESSEDRPVSDIGREKSLNIQEIYPQLIELRTKEQAGSSTQMLLPKLEMTGLEEPTQKAISVIPTTDVVIPISESHRKEAQSKSQDKAVLKADEPLILEREVPENLYAQWAQPFDKPKTAQEAANRAEQVLRNLGMNSLSYDMAASHLNNGGSHFRVTDAARAFNEKRIRAVGLGGGCDVRASVLNGKAKIGETACD